MAQAVRSLSPKQIAERARLHRQAVMLFARLAAKRAVQADLRARGVRVSLVPPAEVMRQAREYLASHPELYQLALERARKLGYVGANVASDAQTEERPKSITSEFTTRQSEKLLQIRDDYTSVSELPGGFSVRIVLEECKNARLDLSEGDEQWILQSYERSPTTIKRKNAGRLMRCARGLHIIEQKYAD
jgi:hypothetical protein